MPRPSNPAVASQIGKRLAQLYGGARASTDWCHLDRSAGFTNQNPQRRNRRGDSPWVKVLHARPGLASEGAALLQAAEHGSGSPSELAQSPHLPLPAAPPSTRLALRPPLRRPSLCQLVHRLRILERFFQPDWSIADKWIAKELLLRGTPAP